MLGSCKGIAHEGTNQPTSIIEAFTPTTPAMAAAWAADEYDADKRYRGMLLLANAPFGGERVYVEMYTKASADEDPAVRAAAIRGLALHGSPEHVPLILRQFDDENRTLRWECARALQRLHNREAIPALLTHMGEKTEDESLVRAACADAMGQYAEPRVLDGLTAALGDRDLSVNDAALRSLRTLTGQDYGDDLREWVAWKKRTTDLFAARRGYIYPVFYRDKTWLETLIPLWVPPNEIAAAPAGMNASSVATEPAPEPSVPAQTSESQQDTGGDTRNN
jgi:hypothetical protein